MNIHFPFLIDGRGRTADADQDSHVRQLIEQVLFTAPGERVNRPTFGTGLMQMVFAPGGSELVAATRFMVQGALQQWVGDLIQLEAVNVEAEDNTLVVTVQYVVKRSQQRKVEQFTRQV